MLYRMLRLLADFLRSHYFSRFMKVGDEFSLKGPLVIVANHPNFFLDPFILATSFPCELYFLAKSTLFTPFTSYLLRLAHLIPVYRQQDGDTERVERNQKTFSEVVRRLHAGGAVVVFPEGVSLGERVLHPVKTGAARIALLAESEKEFSLGVRILPVGITYARFGQFRSSVTVVSGEPISLADFHESYSRNPREAVRELTEAIESGIRSRTVELSHQRTRQLAEDIAELYATRDEGVNDFTRFSEIARHIHVAESLSEAERASIEERLYQFRFLRTQLGLDFDQPLGVPIATPFALGLVTPYLLGLLFTEPPYRFLRWLLKGVEREQLYEGTKKLALGSGVYFLWYVGLLACGLVLTGSVSLALIFWLAAVLCSLVVSWKGHQMRIWLLSKLWPSGASPIALLRIIRDELVNELDRYREGTGARE